MKLTHQQKLSMARKMRSKEEEKKKTPFFETKAWEARQRAIQERVQRTIQHIQAYKAKIKEEALHG